MDNDRKIDRKDKDLLKKETYYVDNTNNEDNRKNIEYEIDNIKIDENDFKMNASFDETGTNNNVIDDSVKDDDSKDNDISSLEENDDMQLDDVSDDSNELQTTDSSSDEIENLDENDDNDNDENDSSKDEKNKDDDKDDLPQEEKKDDVNKDDSSEEKSKEDENSDSSANDNKDDDKESSNEENKDNSGDKERDNEDKPSDDNKKDEKIEDKDNKDNKDNKDKKDDSSKHDKNSKDGEKKSDNSSTEKKKDDSSSKKPDTKGTESKKPNNNPGQNKAPSGRNSGLRDRAQNKLGEKANKLNKKPGQRFSDVARNKLQNSKLGEAAQKGKDAIDKGKKVVDTAKKAGKVAAKAGKAAAKAAKGLIDLFISTLPWSAIVLGVVIAIIAIILLVCFLVPGVGGNVNEEENLTTYSKTDQKTLNKIRDIFEKYPNVDGSLAMAVVEYPYFDSLYGDDVKSFLSTGSKSSEEEEASELENDDTLKDEDETPDNEEVKEEDDTTSDDPYLFIFRSSRNRNRLKKVLKKLSSLSEDEFYEYLKNDYFKKDSGYWGYDKDILTGYNGYKKMIKYVDSSEEEEFFKAIIEDLKEKKELFIDYVFETVACSTSSTSIGYSDAGGVLQGQGVVVLKDTLETNFEKMKNAKTLYGTENLNMTIKRYVMGVAYNEISSELKNEAVAKSVMVASQSFLLGRTAPGSADGVGMGYKTEKKDGKTIFYMRANSYDQGFCDVYEGCDKNAGIYSHTNVEGTASSNGVIYPKEVSIIGYPKLDAASLRNLEKWYDEIAGEFVYDDKTKGFAGNQFDTWGSYCPQGRCLAHQEVIKLAHQNKDYKYILYSRMYSDKRYVTYSMETKTLSAVSSECTPISSDGACGIPDNNYIYYSQRDYASTQFCGRNGASIASSGCGVTSMAMVISNLTDTKVTPPDTMKEAYSGGFCGAGIDGTSAGYFPVAAGNHGLTYKSIAVSAKGVQDALSALKAGGLIIANVGSASPFTSGGHYIVIRKVDANNKVYVGDPNHKELYNTPYDINDFINKGWITHGWWSFTSNKSQSIVKEYCTTAVGDGISTGSMSSPVKGEKPYCGNYPSYPGHTGIDMSVPVGTPIYATDGGTVSVSKDLTGCDGRCCVGGYYSYGRYIEIKHSNGLSTLYAHLSSRDVKEGDKVSKGQLIGKSGANGNTRSGNGCNGPHLHFEVKQNGSPINPCTYMK